MPKYVCPVCDTTINLSIIPSPDTYTLIGQRELFRIRDDLKAIYGTQLSDLDLRRKIYAELLGSLNPELCTVYMCPNCKTLSLFDNDLNLKEIYERRSSSPSKPDS